MIITRTPLRISFAGGGSDLKEYYLKYGGKVVSVAVDKYIYLSMHPYFHQKKYFLKYSSSEMADRVSDIKHRIIKQVFSDYSLQGVDFNSSADVPSGTGMGSSSAFTVGLINLCNAYTGKYMSKPDMAAYASKVEIEKLKEPIGKQDQYACACGGLNYIAFNQDDTVSVEKIVLKSDVYQQFQKNLLLFYTGDVRSASAILKKQRAITGADKKKTDNLHKMCRLATDLRDELCGGRIDSLGEIFHAGWMYKKELVSEISNPKIDHYYELALKNGAEGGKLLGAGGGGFLLFYVKQQNQERLRKALAALEEYPFAFDNIGTTVIYYN